MKPMLKSKTMKQAANEDLDKAVYTFLIHVYLFDYPDLLII